MAAGDCEGFWHECGRERHTNVGADAEVRVCGRVAGALLGGVTSITH